MVERSSVVPAAAILLSAAARSSQSWKKDKEGLPHQALPPPQTPTIPNLYTRDVSHLLLPPTQLINQDQEVCHGHTTERKEIYRENKVIFGCVLYIHPIIVADIHIAQ